MNQALKRLEQPMAIEPGTLRVMAAIASRGRLEAAALSQAKAEWDARKEKPTADEPGMPVEGTGGTLRIVGNVGVLSIDGPLFRHADMFTDISGGTSYNALWRGLEAAWSSPTVRAILLRVNSPGGEVDGLNELADAIAASSKPVWAYADNCCASAAYWLASQAARIVAEPTAELGSIGVRCALIDDSAADAAMGVKEIEIVSSQSPAKRGTPVDEGVIGRVQTRIDDLANIFVAAVARGRGVDSATVLDDFGKGDVMIAQKAVDAGLADEIGDFNSTLAALAGAAVTGGAAAMASPSRSPMAKKTPPAADPAASSAPPVASEATPVAGGDMHCAACGGAASPPVYCKSCFMDHDEPDGDEEEAKAAKAFRAQALALAGTDDPDKALGLIKAGSEALAAARAAEVAAAEQAKAQAQRAVRSAVEAAIQAGRLELAAVAGAVDFLDDEEASEKLRGALASAAGNKGDILAALGGYSFSAKEARRINAWLDTKKSQTPGARTVPADTEENHAEVAQVRDAAQAGGARVYSIAAITAASKKENAR